MNNEMIVLMGVSENPEELLPAFGGLTLKDVGEVAKMTMTRDEALTVRGVNETRRGYSKLKGITQVDTEIPYYVQPSYLETWMKENTEFWLHPVHPSLTPRGLLFTGSPRCLSGDTILHYKRGKRGGGRPITMQSLYRRFNGLPDGKGPFKVDGPTFLHSMREDGVVCYNQILSITKVGIQTCVRITTVKGETITLTPDHLVCLGSGDFVPAGILKGGDELRMKGSMVPKGQGGRKKREVHRREVCVLHHPVAGTKIVNGCTYKRLHFARALVEAQLNGLHYFTFIRRLNLGKLEGLKFLSSNQEVHHIDENPRNDRLSNLTVLDKIEHARLHGKVENFSCEYVTTDFVATVEPAGMRMTYDIEMKSPLHNFAASKFIVYAPNIKNTAHLELP